MIIAMAGLPATGKSTLARALAEKLPALVLNKDLVRAALFPPEEIEYSSSQDDFVIGILLQMAEYYFHKEPARTIILDGRTFLKKAQMDVLVRFSQQVSRELRVILCTCSNEMARERLERDRHAGSHPADDRDYALYRRLQQSSDPLQIPHIQVDTGEPLGRCVQQVLAYLGRGPQ